MKLGSNPETKKIRNEPVTVNPVWLQTFARRQSFKLEVVFGVALPRVRTEPLQDTLRGVDDRDFKRCQCVGAWYKIDST